MCGLFGIVSTERLSEPRHLLEALTDSLAHRGPDARGSLLGDGVFLGHRRLSIIDLAGGAQPMQARSGRYTIVYNGEVYNFDALRAVLEDRGHRFQTRSDTEVVLRSYVEWGDRCLERFNGMFALALWDEASRELFLARDRLGIKPLYYARLGSRLLFASEMKAILGHPDFPRRANLAALSTYLSLRTTVGEQTVFDGLRTLPPGHHLRWRDGAITVREYWDIPLGDGEDPGETRALERSAELLSKAVARRLRSDVPVGAYLSGGLDSSLVVSLMAGLSSEPVRTYSIGFEAAGYDEGPHALAVSRHCGTHHRHLVMDQARYIDLMDELIRHRDEPLSIPHEAALYWLSRQIKDEVDVCLSGEGADELFGGYGRVQRSPMDYRKLELFRRLPGPLRALLSAGVRAPDLRRRLALRGEVDHLLHVYHWWETAKKRELLSSEALAAVDDDAEMRAFVSRLFEARRQKGPYDRVFRFFQKVHLSNLLRRLDMQSMAASVEARVPFVDHELVAFVSDLPVHYKLRWKSTFHRLAAAFTASDRASERLDVTKFLLRELAKRHLPREIVRRRKLGFPVPLDSWFRGSLRQHAREVLLDPVARRRGLFDPRVVERLVATPESAAYDFDGKRLWMLMNVELWFRRHIDRGPDMALSASRQV